MRAPRPCAGSSSSPSTSTRTAGPIAPCNSASRFRLQSPGKGPFCPERPGGSGAGAPDCRCWLALGAEALELLDGLLAAVLLAAVQGVDAESAPADGEDDEDLDGAVVTRAHGVVIGAYGGANRPCSPHLVTLWVESEAGPGQRAAGCQAVRRGFRRWGGVTRRRLRPTSSPRTYVVLLQVLQRPLLRCGP